MNIRTFLALVIILVAIAVGYTAMQLDFSYSDELEEACAELAKVDPQYCK